MTWHLPVIVLALAIIGNSVAIVWLARAVRARGHRWVSGPGGGNEDVVCLWCGRDYPTNHDH
jgi:hypothetical protein